MGQEWCCCALLTSCVFIRGAEIFIFELGFTIQAFPAQIIMKELTYVGVIPARYASTRLPGKPLEKIGDRSIIRHVYERAKKYLDRVIVATDDSRIVDEVASWKGEVTLTSAAHKSGTDRIAEACNLMGVSEDVVINIQGDEPFFPPAILAALKSCFQDSSVNIATPITPINSIVDAANPNLVKVVCRKNGDALYFSRCAIPFVRDNTAITSIPYFSHIGLYAFRRETLAQITQIPTSQLEVSECLEQLRWLENGFQIRTVVITEKLEENAPKGIDTPEDLLRARAYWERLKKTNPDD